MLLESEMSTITKPTKVQPPPKITRAQIDATKSKTEIKKDKEPIETHLSAPLVENVNRIVVDGEEARSVSEAIAILRYLNLMIFRLIDRVFPNLGAPVHCVNLC